jgi:SNF2 family DNA or RNA helicase
VLCPNHLVTQWSDELAKATKLKVAVAATIVQLRQFTYQDFIDYDVVIASYQLLENPKYFFLESTEKKRSSIRNHEEAERSEWVESSLEVGVFYY